MFQQAFRRLFQSPVALIGVLFFFYLFIQHLFLHFGFQTNFEDLYFKDNSTWNVTQGKGLYLDYFGRSYFSEHFYPFHYIISLGYFIKASPVWVFLFQVFCHTLMAVPILKVVHEEYGSKKLLFLAALFLFLWYPFRRLNFGTLYGETVMAPLIAWALYFLYKQRFLGVYLCAFGLLFTKENSAALLVMLGLLLWGKYQKKWPGIVMILGSIAVNVFLIKVFIPHFLTHDYKFTSYFGTFGGSFSEIVMTLLTEVGLVVKKLFSSQEIGYLAGLFLPIGGLCFFHPFMWVGLGLVMQNLLSSVQPSMLDIAGHYSQPLIPIILMSAVLGAKKVFASTKLKRWFWPGAAFFLGLGLFLNVILFVALDLRAFWIDQHVSDSHRILATIPADASVCASSHYSTHLNYRETLNIFPYCNDNDLVFVEDLRYFFDTDEDANTVIKREWRSGSKKRVIKELLLGQRGTSPASRSEYIQAVEAVKQNSDYVLQDQGLDVFLYKKI